MEQGERNFNLQQVTCCGFLALVKWPANLHSLATFLYLLLNFTQLCPNLKAKDLRKHTKGCLRSPVYKIIRKQRAMTVILLKVRFCSPSKDITVFLIAEWEQLIPWERDSTSSSAYHITRKENPERAKIQLLSWTTRAPFFEGCSPAV